MVPSALAVHGMELEVSEMRWDIELVESDCEYVNLCGKQCVKQCVNERMGEMRWCCCCS